MENEEILKTIKTKCNEAEIQVVEGKMPVVTVPVENFRQLMEVLKNESSLSFDYPMSQTALDNPEKNIITSVYHLYSMEHKHHVEVKVDLDRQTPMVPTVSDLWRGCEWFERETYDMYGVVFENHPDLRRIMLSDDWVGWPLRKDYKDSRIVPRPQR